MEEQSWSRGRNGRRFSREEWAAEETSSAIGYHVSMRLADDGGIARTPGGLRVASRLILKHGEHRGLAGHRIADNHGHSILLGTREEAGTFANVVEGALRVCLRIGVPFQPCRIRPITSERHLFNSLPYLFRQEEHHGTAFDELHDGSSLPELLGMRLGSPWVVRRVRAALPRLKRETLLDWLNAPLLDDEPLDVRYLADAAAAAWSVTDLHGNAADAIRARRVAIHMLDRLAPNAGASSTLGIPARSASRYRRQDVSAAELRAVELQMKHRGLVDRRRREKEGA